VYDYI